MVQMEKDTEEVVERVAEEDEVRQRERVGVRVEAGKVEGLEEKKEERVGLSLLVTH